MNGFAEQLDGNGDGTGGDDFIRTFSVRDSDGDGVLDGEDAVCSGVDLIVQNAVYESGKTVVCTATSSLRTKGLFLVNPGADVTLNSPLVDFANGVGVVGSGRLTARD